MSDHFHDFETARIRLPGGTLLFGKATNRTIKFWKIALRQERLHPLATQGLRYVENCAGLQLIVFLHRIGMASKYLADSSNPMTQIQQAIKNRQISAVFIPNPPICYCAGVPVSTSGHASVRRQSPSLPHRAGASAVHSPDPGRKVHQNFVGTDVSRVAQSHDSTKFDGIVPLKLTIHPLGAKLPIEQLGAKSTGDLSRMTRNERVEEMHRRVEDRLKGNLKAAYRSLFTDQGAKAVAAMTGLFLTLAAIHKVSKTIGAVVDAALIAIAYYEASKDGLHGMYLLTEAHIEAMDADTDAKMEAAVQLGHDGAGEVGSAALLTLGAWLSQTRLGKISKGSASSETEGAAVQGASSPNATKAQSWRNTAETNPSRTRSGGISSSAQPARSKGKRNAPNSSLPRKTSGEFAPDPAAEGRPHTVIGTKIAGKDRFGASRETYTQGVTFDEGGNIKGKIDVTNHGRADHPNPHYHPYLGSGGKQFGPAINIPQN